MHSDADLIRAEIDRTAKRVEEGLAVLEERARLAARTAVAWSVVTAAALTIIAAATIVWRIRRRPPARLLRLHDGGAPAGDARVRSARSSA